MPALVKVLLPGYVSGKNNGHSCSTVTLVIDKDLKIIVDPGTLASPGLLIDALAKENLRPEDINLVFLTHAHTDHFRYVGLFAEAKILDYWGYWQADVNTEAKSQVSENISLLNTPGHSYDGLSMIVRTDAGTVVICGDVFWQKDLPVIDPYASDQKALEESRQLVKKVADYIIPGHDDMYQVK